MGHLAEAAAGRVLMLRHGQSEWNAERRWQGWADPPLTDLGVAQAHAAAERLQGLGLEAVATSDLRRARMTAEVIADRLQLASVLVDPDLRERDVGQWSGLTTDEIEARWPGQLDAWRQGRLASPPGGEADMLPCVLPAIERRLATGQAWLVVAHGGVIHAVDRHLGADPTPVYNLCGRWVETGPDGPYAGDVVLVPEVDSPTTIL